LQNRFTEAQIMTAERILTTNPQFLSCQYIFWEMCPNLSYKIGISALRMNRFPAWLNGSDTLRGNEDVLRPAATPECVPTPERGNEGVSEAAESGNMLHG